MEVNQAEMQKLEAAVEAAGETVVELMQSQLALVSLGRGDVSFA